LNTFNCIRYGVNLKQGKQSLHQSEISKILNPPISNRIKVQRQSVHPRATTIFQWLINEYLSIVHVQKELHQLHFLILLYHNI